MPSRRDLIRMSESQIREYLESQRRVILVTNGLDGMPHPVPMEYGLDADGTIIMTSFRKSQKIRNLERDPRAVLLFESGMRYQELMGVIAYCHAAIISDPHVVRKLMRLIRARDVLRESMSPEMRAQVAASFPKRVAVCLKPFRFVSWDHGKLANSY
jgi:nitroimidazol reductase NimA-like FMN-containing flavoprotein (pyridoxamine 5'-phosphate oxidase superfamily)